MFSTAPRAWAGRTSLTLVRLCLHWSPSQHCHRVVRAEGGLRRAWGGQARRRGEVVDGMLGGRGRGAWMQRCFRGMGRRLLGAAGSAGSAGSADSEGAVEGAGAVTIKKGRRGDWAVTMKRRRQRGRVELGRARAVVSRPSSAQIVGGPGSVRRHGLGRLGCDIP